MAAYLSLRHKETGKLYAGSGLVVVDEMLCEHLGIKPDPEKWHMDWMNWVGFCIAYRADKPITDALAPMRKNARASERRLLDWFADTFENESYHGF